MGEREATAGALPRTVRAPASTPLSKPQVPRLEPNCALLGGARVLGTSLPPPTRRGHGPLPLRCVVRGPLGQRLTWSRRSGETDPREGVHAKDRAAQGRKDDLALRGWRVLLESGQEKVSSSGEGSVGGGEKARLQRWSGVSAVGRVCTAGGPGRNRTTELSFESNPVGGWGPLSPSRRSRGRWGLHCSEAEGQPLSAVLCFGGAVTRGCGPRRAGSSWGSRPEPEAPRACHRRGDHAGQVPAQPGKPLSGLLSLVHCLL